VIPASTQRSRRDRAEHRRHVRDALLQVGGRPCPHCDRVMVPLSELIPWHRPYGAHRPCPASQTPWPTSSDPDVPSHAGVDIPT